MISPKLIIYKTYPNQNSQIRQPVCERGSGGACLAGQQQCCNQQSRTRKVCRRVPYTVEEDVFMPGRRGIDIRCNLAQTY